MKDAWFQQDTGPVKVDFFKPVKKVNEGLSCRNICYSFRNSNIFYSSRNSNIFYRSRNSNICYIAMEQRMITILFCGPWRWGGGGIPAWKNNGVWKRIKIMVKIAP